MGLRGPNGSPGAPVSAIFSDIIMDACLQEFQFNDADAFVDTHTCIKMQNLGLDTPE